MPPARPPASFLERVSCVFEALVVIALGLVWRLPALPLSPFSKKYGADALWAMLVFLLIRFLWPRWHVWKSAGVAFAASVAVELSQLYHAGWIDAIRATRLGALSLGSVFNLPDIAAYAAGIAIVTLLRLRFQPKLKPAAP